MPNSKLQSGHDPPEEEVLIPPEVAAYEPGSKQAVLRHFGVFQDDADLEEQLAGIRARREEAGE